MTTWSSAKTRCATLAATVAVALYVTACRDEAPPQPFNVNLGAADRPLMPMALPPFDPALGAARADDIIPLADLQPQSPNDDADPASTGAADADTADDQPQSVTDFIAALRSADPPPDFVDQVVIYLLDAPDFTVDAAVEKALGDAGDILKDASLAADARDRRLVDILKNIGLPIDVGADDDGG